MTHTTSNPHDAEEAMRPYLSDVYESGLPLGASPDAADWNSHAPAQINALYAALDKALDLLGVSR